MKTSRLAAAASGLAALALAVAAAGGLTTSAASAAPSPASYSGPGMLGPNQVAMGDQVPWAQVGHGWYLSSIDLGPRGQMGSINAHNQLLDLVDPLGGRYQMLKTKVGPAQRGYWTLADWAPHLNEALLFANGGSGHARAIQVDLKAGVRHVIPLGSNVASIALAPHGGVYATHLGGNAGESLFRIDHDGSVRRLARDTDGMPLPTPSGQQLVVAPQSSQTHAFRVVTSAGHLVRTLPLPHSCSAQRWWRAGVVMASCWVHDTTELFGVPLDGGHVFKITDYHGKHSRDLGDLDARVLHGTTYLEAAGPCGVVFLGRQHADGSATLVHVPHARGNVYLIGTTARSLVLHHGVSCDGGTVRDSISHFDPTTGKDRVVALLPTDEAYDRILAYGERLQLQS
jgi:hypothetical protein